MSTCPRRAIVACTIGIALSALVGGCSATEDDSSFDPTGGDPSGSGSSGEGGGLGLGGEGGGTGTGDACSADMQNVVDANGNIVFECPPDQGCFEGKCIPACEAAANSRGNIGCDFWAPDPPFLQNESPGASLAGPCYAVFLANTWKRSAKITITRGGQSFDATAFGRIPKGVGPATTYDPLPPEGLPPNEVAVLFLSHRPGVVNFTSLECPVPPAVLDDAAVHNSGLGTAFHVESDTPVSSYDILPYGGATSYLPSATLLFPSTAWGTNYYALAPLNNGSGSLWVAVLAAEDNTTVSVVPPMTLPGGGAVPTANQGQVTQVVLNKGEFAQWLSVGTDPTSTVFDSDKPIGLFTGNTYLGVQSSTSGPGGQDSAHQQIPHVKALGNEYIGAGVPTRLASMQPESVLYRVLGVVDGTALTWDPAPPAGAPNTLAAGQVAEFQSTQAFSVRSQDTDHPFAFTQYLAGAPTEGISRPDCAPVPPIDFLTCGLGDEEWVTLIAPEQFLQRYVFFTDPTYATTNLVVIRVKGATGFADVQVGCLGNIGGWQPVGAGGVYEYAHVDLVRGTQPLGSCGVSRHEASSTGKFGVVVWGTDYYSSYGYPAGGNVGSINNVVVPPVPK